MTKSTSHKRFAKRLLYIGIIGVVIYWLGIIIFHSFAPIGKDFCIGTSGINIKKIEITGQGREALIVDKTLIDYLVRRPKLRSLPIGEQLNGGSSYEARVYDQYLGHDRFVLLVGDDGRVIQLGYFESPSAEANYTYLTIGTDAPPNLADLIRFLLSDANRGKNWIK